MSRAGDAGKWWRSAKRKAAARSPALVVLAIAACGGADLPAVQAPSTPIPAPFDASPPDAEPDAAVSVMQIDAAVPEPPAAAAEPEVWLKGSTHVHARPSGDSSEPIDKVIAWYETHGYDFIALTDHNRVTETMTQAAGHRLIVLPGVELTHNPTGCLPQGDKSRKCRIHVNALGVSGRPDGKIEWAERKSHARLDMYDAALKESRSLGASVVQINHPQWYWGMSGELLAELAGRGARLVEIANVQFTKWNNGDADHASTEALWDAALVRGATLWGVASDDAHDYEGHHQKWPAGGGWIVVHARRDPKAILDALAAGRFYASTGVALARDEVDAGELVVEVAPGERGTHDIAWIENGKLVATTHGTTGRRGLPAAGYLRAVITRDDGAHAWVEPVRR